jgi:hypothetical protein
LTTVWSRKMKVLLRKRNFAFETFYLWATTFQQHGTIIPMDPKCNWINNLLSAWKKDAEPKITKKDAKKSVTIDVQELKKIESVYQIRKSEKHQEILNHPVIASYLRWKWQLVWMPYLLNMLLIVSFAMIMTSYICYR